MPGRPEDDRLETISPKVDDETLHLGSDSWTGDRVNDFFF